MSNIPTIESTVTQFRRKRQLYDFHFWFNIVVFEYYIFQQLPVKIYESVIDIVQGDATMLFVNLPYTLATEEAERIGVDHVVRMSTHEKGGKSAGTLSELPPYVKLISSCFFFLFSSLLLFPRSCWALDSTAQRHQDVAFTCQIDPVVH